MKRTLKIFFLLHFFVIITLSITVVIEAYYTHRYNKTAQIPLLSFLKNGIYKNKKFNNYLILSGTNTGYGFYGISVATEKYFEIELYDSSKKLIRSDIYFDFNSASGFSRFKGYASHIANYLEDTKEIRKNDSTAEGKKNFAIREKYIEKVFKWLGKNYAGAFPDCHYYKVKLNTIVPIDIWTKQLNENPKVYVIKEMEFPITKA